MNQYKYPDIVPWAFAILSLAAVIGALVGTYHLWLASRSHRWPREKGTIIRSVMEETRSDEGNISYTPVIKYGYVVKGKSYTADRVEFGEGSLENIESKRRRVSMYKPNQPVTVFYDPGDPSMAVLKRGSRSGLFWATVVSYLMVMASGLILWKIVIPMVTRH